MKVLTTAGLVERSELTERDIVTESDNARAVATEWYLDGNMVRRDVWVNTLRGVEVKPESP